jgi:molybdopterin-binding protein
MISVKGLSYSAGEFNLHDISFDVGKGETLVVLGPTGAGKTVLLEILAGCRHPRSGSVAVGGTDVTHLPPEKRGIGLVYQDYLLFPHLDVFDNIAYGLRATALGHDEVDTEVRATAAQMKVSHLLHRRTRNLSGGEQQRVALARTLITRPKAVLLDEPFSAVDPNTKEALMRELSGILEDRGLTTVYVTHDQVEAMEMADRIAVMNAGRIVQIDTPEEVFRAPRSEFVANFVGIRNILKGVARREGSTTLVSVGGVGLVSSVELQGDVHVTLRPEDIIVSRHKLESSARNSLSGEVVSVVEKGPVVYVTAACGPQLTAAVTKESFKELRVTLGDEVFMTFKASNVNIF